MAKAKKEKAPSAASVDPGISIPFYNDILIHFVGEIAVLNYLKTQNRPYSAGTNDRIA